MFPTRAFCQRVASGVRLRFLLAATLPLAEVDAIPRHARDESLPMLGPLGDHDRTKPSSVRTAKAF